MSELRSFNISQYIFEAEVVFEFERLIVDITVFFVAIIIPYFLSDLTSFKHSQHHPHHPHMPPAILLCLQRRNRQHLIIPFVTTNNMPANISVHFLTRHRSHHHILRMILHLKKKDSALRENTIQLTSGTFKSHPISTRMIKMNKSVIPLLSGKNLRMLIPHQIH